MNFTQRFLIVLDMLDRIGCELAVCEYQKA